MAMRMSDERIAEIRQHLDRTVVPSLLVARDLLNELVLRKAECEQLDREAIAAIGTIDRLRARVATLEQMIERLQWPAPTRSGNGPWREGDCPDCALDAALRGGE